MKLAAAKIAFTLTATEARLMRVAVELAIDNAEPREAFDLVQTRGLLDLQLAHGRSELHVEMVPSVAGLVAVACEVLAEEVAEGEPPRPLTNDDDAEDLAEMCRAFVRFAGSARALASWRA